ncbi:transporter substrate-binding domain-containing protein [Methylonatrum kenyense]|uniref:substrate-binding periplasmic protein n=1 Tax=Methylonatrum kenyense TaxID=455253 RepID=UPI0020BFCA42|nr:transporter substrate-binding domain-containing protein [Methylonatrum kenyense]MCK8516037.1 transporter substrate-binding domain-containing protein [Methylonatrum kenyense]
MRKRWSSVMGVKGAVIGALAGAALLGSATASADRMDEIRDGGTLKIAVYNDFAPYSCVGLERDLTGVDVELANALGESLGVNVELFGFSAADSMDADLERLMDEERDDSWRDDYFPDRAPDLMMHVPIDPVFAARNPEYEFTAGYFHEAMAVLYDREQLGELPAVVNTPDPFIGERIGVEMYTLSYVFLTNGFDGRLRETTVNHKSVVEAVESLLKGDVSAVMAPRGELHAALATFPEVEGSFGMSGLDDLFRTDRVRSAWDVGVALQSGNPALQEAVEQAMADLIEDGTVAEIFGYYGIAWTAARGETSANGAMPAGDGPAGVARQGLDRSRVCRATVPAGLY